MVGLLDNTMNIRSTICYKDKYFFKKESDVGMLLNGQHRNKLHVELLLTCLQSTKVLKQGACRDGIIEEV